MNVGEAIKYNFRGDVLQRNIILGLALVLNALLLPLVYFM